jgi:hypothetical protein
VLFRDRLNAELSRRWQRNPRYSLRAFARDLATDHATLSQILRKQRPLSARMVPALGNRLKLDQATVSDCCARQNAEAVLRMLRSGKARRDTRWIAMRTGISVDAVNAALHWLLSNGVLKMTSTQRWEIKT